MDCSHIHAGAWSNQYGMTHSGFMRPLLAALGFSGALLGLNTATAQVPDGWDWAKHLVTAKDEYALANAVDSTNRMVYTAGGAVDGYHSLLGTAWDLIFGANTQADGYLCKQDLDGTNKWQFVVGGAGDDAISGVCVDAAGRVYITGWFMGPNASFKGVSGSDQWMSSAGGKDMFVACYSPSGVLQWKMRAGGSEDDFGTGICHAGGKVFVTGRYGSVPDASWVPATADGSAFLFALDADNGNMLWRVFASDNDDASFNAVAADEGQVYAIGTYEGPDHTYFGATFAPMPLGVASPARGANILAMGHGGDFRWARAITNSGDDEVQASGIAVSAKGLYISGSTHDNSIFPGGLVVSDANGSHDHGYLARLDKATGGTQWVRTFSGTVAHAQVGIDLAVDSHGDVLMSGTYNGSTTLAPGLSVSTSTGLKIFLAKFDATGKAKWVMAPTGSGTHIPHGVATDRAGKVCLAGSYTNSLTIKDPWSDGNSRSLFMATLTDLDHEVQAFHDPSSYHPFGPLCEGDAAIDLATLLVPRKAGPGAAVVSSSGIGSGGIYSPAGALGIGAGGAALFDNTNDQLVIDLGDTIPAGEQLILRWRKVTSGTASLNVLGSLEPATGYVDLGTWPNTSSSYVLTGITAAAPMRFVKLTRGAGAQCAVDAVFYCFGSDLDGTWSGAGVTGHSFSPGGLSGEVAVTYTAQGQSTTHLITVDHFPVGGSPTVAGMVCPGSDAPIILGGAIGEVTSWHWKADNASAWHEEASGTDTYTLGNVILPTQVFATVGNGACPEVSSDTITVVPQDTDPPVFTRCTGDTTVYVPATACDVTVVYDPPEATDNCSVPTVTVDDAAHQPGQSFPVGTTTVRYTATDASGNTATCEFTITVMDTIAPSITCPAPITTGTNVGCLATGINLGTPIASDNCTQLLVTNAIPANYPRGTHSVIWTVIDAAGNGTSCTQTVTVVDDVAPSITCPGNVQAYTNAGCGASNVLLGTPTAGDNCTVVSIANDAPAIFPVDTSFVQWTVTDAAGNQVSCMQQVVVIDNQPPSITCPDPMTVSTNSGCAASGVALGLPVTNDNCWIKQVVNTAPTLFSLGITNVVWTVTDRAGLSASCTQTVTVVDDVAPAIICPNDIQVVAGAACNAINVPLGLPTATDNCGVSYVTSNAPAVFPQHETIVTWTVTDNSGNTQTCQQVVNVIDAMPPTITCPDPVMVSSNAGCTAVNVDLGTPVALDACDTPTLSNNAPLAYPVGQTLVTWTATDASSNISTCTQQVTVIDDTPPLARCRPVTISLDNDGVATVATAQVDDGSSDNCTITSISLTTTVYHAVGTYTDTLIVTDAAGNSDTCFAQITVVDHSAPVAICNDITLHLDADGNAGLTAADLDGGSHDNGEIVAMNASHTAFSCADIGSNNVTLTVTDDGGNTASCTAIVTVLDTIAPLINCPADTTLSAGTDCSVTDPMVGTPVVVDNCSGFNVSNDAPPSLPMGTSTITWTVTDAGMNSASCTQHIAVIDDTPPMAQCKPATIILDADGVATVATAQVDDGSSDNCTITSISLTTTVYHAVGTYTDTLIVTDAAGNSDTCFAQITVVDHSAPVAICNDITLHLDADGNAGLTAADLDGGSHDNGEIVAMNASHTAFSCADIGSNNVTLTVTDDGGNTASCTAIVTVLDTIAPNTDGHATAGFCMDASLQDLSTLITENLSPNGSWTAPGGIASGGWFNPATGGSGQYIYSAPSLAGCGTDTFRVDVDVYPLPFAGSDTSVVLCSSEPAIGLINLLPGADPGGSWSIGTGTYDPAAMGSSTVAYVVTGDHGCTPDTALVEVTVVPAPHAGVGTLLNICADAGVVDLFTLLGGTPDAGGWWTDPGGNPFNGLFDPAQHGGGEYLYTVEGIPPCASSSAVIAITRLDVPSAAWTPPGPICAGAGPVDLSSCVSGEPGGTWTGQGIINGHYFDPQGIAIGGASSTVELAYSVTVAGCNASAQGNITVDAMPLADAGNEASVCGLTHTLSAAPTFGTGTWSTQGTAGIADPGSANTTITAEAPGSHVLLWTVVNGTCSATDSVVVDFHLAEELSLVDAGEDRTQDISTSMELHGQVEGATESWWSVATGQGMFDDAHAPVTQVWGLAIGDNVLVLSARVGNCPVERDTVVITVRGLLIPTGFSPNGDGVNDRYEIRGLEELPPASLQVHDRWGNLVFHAGHYRNEWDGNGDNGQPLMDGTYFGILTIAGQEPWKGNITLKR